jgi:hypothetical protein
MRRIELCSEFGSCQVTLLYKGRPIFLITHVLILTSPSISANHTTASNTLVMPDFHPFPYLPLELRQNIWEFAMEPREVAVGCALKLRSLTQPPPILHVCAEARSHLQRHYTKSFTRKLPSKLSLVNFDIDTVYCSADYLPSCRDSDLPSVQRLIVECWESEFFFRDSGRALYMASTLRSVTILHHGPDAEGENWWMGWDSMMEEWYYRDDPVAFRTRIISLEDPHHTEVDQDNYLKLERDLRRAHQPTLEEEPDYPGMSDSEDDVDAPWRFRMGYRHVDGCNCPSRR